MVLLLLLLLLVVAVTVLLLLLLLFVIVFGRFPFLHRRGIFNVRIPVVHKTSDLLILSAKLLIPLLWFVNRQRQRQREKGVGKGGGLLPPPGSEPATSKPCVLTTRVTQHQTKIVGYLATPPQA